MNTYAWYLIGTKSNTLMQWNFSVFIISNVNKSYKWIVHPMYHTIHWMYDPEGCSRTGNWDDWQIFHELLWDQIGQWHCGQKVFLYFDSSISILRQTVILIYRISYSCVDMCTYQNKTFLVPELFCKNDCHSV